MKLLGSKRGTSLIETMIAVVIALVGVFGMGAAIYQATTTNKNQGSETTRATIYAQDKIEKLLSLDFTSCTQSPSLQPSTCNSTGISDSGWTIGLIAGGPISTTSATALPVALDCPTVPSASQGYIDFLDSNGTQLTGSCSSVTGVSISYIREWTVADLNPFTTTPALKQITVAVYSQAAVTATGGKPIVVVTSTLSNPN